jgi:hypothetical protein
VRSARRNNSDYESAVRRPGRVLEYIIAIKWRGRCSARRIIRLGRDPE